MEIAERILAGWGRTSPSAASVVTATADELTEDGALADLLGNGRGAIARGLGRSYGDPAQNGGGTVIEVQPGAQPIRLDEATATAHVDAGVSLDTLLREIVPKGWFVPVTPGTRFVTVGGAVASDIHGKGHHSDGSFGAHVTRLGMLLADGSTRSITPESDPDLFWATIGGMGLTGIITDVSFRVIPVETRHFVVETRRVPNFDALVDAMEQGDRSYRYSVAWIDLVATGKHLGRSVLSMGNHASLAELQEMNPKAARSPLDFDPRVFPDIPSGVPNVLTRPAVRAFNELWYRKTPKHHHGTESITQFFHPLDMVGQWTRLYGAHGFLQYQFVVPFDAVDTMRTIVARISDEGHASFLAVLKRLGAESGGLLSFPKPGWTLTLDLPAGVDGLGLLLSELDDLVLGVGGRHYLAKDAFATPAVVAAGYPRLDEWKRIRNRVDPHGAWASDQARRLQLI
ncbi:FAD-binding protein [Ilumatobacter coccineus]|uniref:Putative oxidoreductase n=1 Tax=Ilumatobacter coccineus (strain NBRC 103263 / KCTC 29153 / YM16-304) TaxID=1313172 RepID=A0A6C7ECB0_ILUCY|nr:FAD-binding oxidoreductase [Ilumatobacter coccineus]BAN02819.1 putative oxidoreductase [Ilumatobacter coccineus YM16-304]